MKKKYLSLLILPLLVISVSSCDSITIIDSREDISPTNPSDSTNLDTNTYSIVVGDIPSVSVGKSSPVSVTLITTTDDGDTTYVSGDSSDVLLISSDTSILTVSKMNLVGVKVGYADLTVRWASHPTASVTVDDIQVDIGYTYDVTLNYYIDDVDDEDGDTGDDNPGDDDDDDDDVDEPEESGPVAVSSISLDIEDTLSLSDFEILLGTLVDDGIEPEYRQVEFTDEEYQGEDIVTFVSSDEEVLKVCECGDHVIALTSGKADLSVYWEDHEVYSNSIQVTVNETDEGDDGGNTEPDPDDGSDTD